MKLVALSILALTAVSLQAQTSIVIPNFGFNDGEHKYTTPADWEQDYVQGTGTATWVGTWTSATSGDFTLTPEEGLSYATMRIPTYSGYTGISRGTISTAESIGTFQANTTYTLTAYFGNLNFNLNAFGILGLRAIDPETSTSVDVGESTLAMVSLTRGEWYELTYTVDTSVDTTIVGKDIDIYIGWQIDNADNPYGREMSFDNVTLTAQSNIPEASTYALGLGALTLVLGLLRRRARKNAA